MGDCRAGRLGAATNVVLFKLCVLILYTLYPYDIRTISIPVYVIAGQRTDSNPVAKGRMRRRQWSISHFYYQRYISRASSLSTLLLLSSPERLAPNIGTNKNERALQRSDLEINISTRQSPTLGLLSVNADSEQVCTRSTRYLQNVYTQEHL